ncbi:hypothetical protein HYS50_03155 [Candidatus Woesearchaeota archaeon]|nr:hypothetical protein [Candidatus Woesearchaeota archaeon]
MAKEISHIPWASVTLVLLAIATVGYFTQPGISGALVYRDYGYGGYGGFGGGYGGGFLGYGGLSITAFYEQYQIYIDSIIFLLIFLSVGKALFLSHFGSGGKTLYIAIGLALTLGLLLWEEQTGFSIIYNLGPIGVIALLLILFGGVYFAVLRITDSHVKALLVTIFIGYLVHRMFPDLITYLPDIFYRLFSAPTSADDFLGRIVFIGFIVLLIWFFFKAKKTKRFPWPSS